MARTDTEIEREITRLQKSPLVALAQMYESVRYQRLELYNTLANLEQLGEELESAGITKEILEDFGAPVW